MPDFSPFEPDKSYINGAASTAIEGALPVADGWGPAKDFAAYGAALPAKCIGSITARDSNNDFHIFAGTSTGLYRYNSGTLSWDDVTRASGGYTVPDGDYWSMIQWGNTVIFTSVNDNVQVFDLATSTVFDDLAGSPPRAKYVTTAGDFVVLMNISGHPSRAQWCGIGNSTQWAVGEELADFQDFPDGGSIIGGVRSELGATVIQQKGIRQLEFNAGSGLVFSARLVNPTRGCVSPASLVDVAGTFFYLDEDGFYQGPEGSPIGAEKVNRWFLDEIGPFELTVVQGAADPLNKIVWWRFTRTDGTNALIGYDWQLQRWAYIDLDVEYISSAYTPGYTLDGLDAVNTSVDDLVFSLDSRVWLGGRPTFALFNASHIMGFMEGSNRAAVLETADAVLGGTDSRAFVNGFRAVTDAKNHTGQISQRDTHYDTPTWTPAAAPDATGLIPARSNARLHRFRVNIASDETWTRAHSVEPVARPGGKR